MSMPDSPTDRLFLTNHALALLCLARRPNARARDVAAEVGVTERSAQRLISDLVAGGYLERTRVGRRNNYRVNRRAHLGHTAIDDKSVGTLLDALLT
jgi:DNA-binding MarR family transcriptional regulator